MTPLFNGFMRESRDYCKLLTDSGDVKLRIDDKYVVQVTCAFRCSGIWPRSANHWPNANVMWPNLATTNEVKNEGFDLSSRETAVLAAQQNKQTSSMEGDAWAMNMTHAENLLLGESPPLEMIWK